MATPQRIQLSRKRGFNLQKVSRALNGFVAVKIDRTTRWGNPFVVQFDPHPDYSPQTAEAAVAMFKRLVDGAKRPPFDTETIRKELKGKNLACWCKPGAPCHADYLLEIANS